MIRFVACVLAVYVLVGPAGAQQGASDPPVSGRTHDSEFANFSHWSAVVDRGPQRTEIEYAVCNFHKTTALIYRWVGPNFGVGDGGTLPVGKCHTVIREAPATEYDRTTVIEFTQARREYSAPAHLSKFVPAIIGSALPGFVRHRLRAFYGTESRTQPNLADLVITQTRSNDFVEHVITWRPPKVTVAIALTAFGSASANDVIQQMKFANYEVVASTLKDILPESSLPAIPAARQSAPVLVIKKTDKSALDLHLKINAKTQTLSRSHVSLIDAESNKLIIDTEMNVYSP